jgi:glycosyltransferase involved in cell wall biosynthesis
MQSAGRFWKNRPYFSASRIGVNVLHIDEQRGWRGGEQQASYLIQGLARRGHRVFVVGRPGSLFLKSDHAGASPMCIAAPFITEFDLYTALLLARAVRRHQIDILHAHTSHAHMAACLARQLAGGGKVVVSRRVDFAPRRGLFSRWKYSLPDHIVAVSNAIADVMRAYGVEETRLTVVSSATDPVRFDVSPLPRHMLGVPEGAPLLGNVAALVGHKDHATLLNAITLVIKHLPELHLVIAGEGVLRPRLEARIARLDLGNAVHLLGHRNDVPRLLRALDAFVLSSNLEGRGGAVLEAMICEVPVVATAAGGLPELVVHEKTGFLSPVGDADSLATSIIRVFQEPALAREMAVRAASNVREKFCVDAMVEGNIRVYERVLAE